VVPKDFACCAIFDTGAGECLDKIIRDAGVLRAAMARSVGRRHCPHCRRVARKPRAAKYRPALGRPWNRLDVLGLGPAS
jgi:hypothetical protein